MKTKILFGLLVAMAMPLGALHAQSPAASVSSTTTAALTSLPAGAAEVAKLSGAGLGNDVLLAYVNSYPSMYSLSANAIVQLKEQGVSPVVITAMLNHDTMLRNNSTASAPTAPAPPVASSEPDPPPLTSTATATVYTPPAQVVQTAPTVQYVPVSPGPDYYWAPGYYGYDGLWITGAWWPRAYYGYGYGYGYGWGWRGGGFHEGFRGGDFRGGGGFHGGGGDFHGGGGGFHGGGGSHGGHR